MKTNIIYLCLVLLFCWGCSKAPSIEPEPETPKETPEVPDVPETPVTPETPTYIAPLWINLEPQGKEWAANGNHFAIGLLAKAISEAAEKEADKENVMLSPLSLQLALGMLANGLTDEAFAEMAAVMGFDDGTAESMNNYFHKLSAALTESELDVELALANSIWIQENFQVKDAFIQTNKEVYGAEVSNVNFADPATKNLINNWCDKHTRGTIKEIQLELSPMTRLVLANATYFKGAWSMPFEVKDTGPGIFTTSKGRKQEVNMMKMKEYLLYTSNEQFQAVELPYGNRSFSMIVILPSGESSTDELLAAIEWDRLQMGVYMVDLSLPKFETRCTTNLIALLKAAGIRKIFEDSALANIADGIFIGQFAQEMYLNVDETGSEASAVTYLGLLGSSGLPEETAVMHVDRPFIFAIRENSSGVILFTGKIGKIEE